MYAGEPLGPMVHTENDLDSSVAINPGSYATSPRLVASCYS